MSWRTWTKIFLALFLLAFIAWPLFIVQSGKKQIYADVALVPSHEVAIVFGASVLSSGAPSDVLRDRLDVAADLFVNERVRSIIVSGDNRTENYNEPESMAVYLVNERGVPEDAIFQDFAGRRTYDTCARAHELWGVEDALLVTQGFHLPRAIWTCEQLGIESDGISASLQGYVKSAVFEAREVLAIYKAFIDVYIWAPAYVGGDEEADLIPDAE
jgi:SanA protein